MCTQLSGIQHLVHTQTRAMATCNMLEQNQPIGVIPPVSAIWTWKKKPVLSSPWDLAVLGQNGDRSPGKLQQKSWVDRGSTSSAGSRLGWPVALYHLGSASFQRQCREDAISQLCKKYPLVFAFCSRYHYSIWAGSFLQVQESSLLLASSVLKE